MVTILSIDGGGIRGIIPATVLADLEERTGKPICALFDLIAGTSTGGILATALSAPDARGLPKHTAKEVLAAYFLHGGEIFHKSTLRAVTTLGGLIRPRYSPRVLNTLLSQYLGEVRLHATLTEILVTAYDMASSTPWFFKTSFARHHRNSLDDPLLTEVAYATAAAPTYFPPLTLSGHCLVDGGVFASNPALCAYAQARNMYPAERDFLLVSLGTGAQAHDRPCSKVKNWGIVDWAVPISAVMLNASSAAVDYQMRALLGTQSYLRLQTRLPEGAPGMDDASDENLKRLEALGTQVVAENAAALEALSRTLLTRGAKPLRTSLPPQGPASPLRVKP